MKTPPSWLTRPCPNGVETRQQEVQFVKHLKTRQLASYLFSKTLWKLYMYKINKQTTTPHNSHVTGYVGIRAVKYVKAFIKYILASWTTVLLNTSFFKGYIQTQKLHLCLNSRHKIDMKYYKFKTNHHIAQSDFLSSNRHLKSSFCFSFCFVYFWFWFFTVLKMFRSHFFHLCSSFFALS